MTTPKEDGLTMPAEWQAHSQCWMAWPSDGSMWGDRLPAVEEAYAAVARAIADFEPVSMVAAPENAARVSLACGRGVSVLTLPHDDGWLRDTGPTSVTDGPPTAEGDVGVAGVDWQFNAWGQVAGHFGNDALVAKEMLSHLKMRRYAAPLVLEGGSFHVDGEGTVLANEKCLLNPNRNPELGRDEIEKLLCDHLGADKVIWLAGGLTEDHTDGHVDNVACFARPGVVIALTTQDADDEDCEILEENIARLRSATDARGRELEVIQIPQPRRREHQGRRLAMSYVNFYLANGAVIAPQFDQPEDKKALAVLKEAFPERAIVPVDSIAFAYGGIHGITQQQPAGTPLPERN